MSVSLLQETMSVFGGNVLLERVALASLEVAALAVVVWLVCRAGWVKSPRLRALMWLVVLAKPILSIGIGSPMPVVAIERPAEPAGVVVFAGNAGGDLDEMIAAQLERDAEQLARVAGTSVDAAALAESLRADAAADREEIAGISAATTSAPAGSAGVRLHTVLLALWALGVVVMAAVMLLDLVKVRRLERRGAAVPEALQTKAEAIAREIGLRRVPTLRVVAAIESPALVGVWRPVVFLPSWLAADADSAQAAWLLRHELMHARNHDSLALMVRRAAEALFFFHPVVWYAGKQWEEATELACDRALVESNDEARDYARQLLGVLESHHVARPMAMGPGLFATRTQIGRRIAALVANPLQHPARLGAMGLLALAVMGAGAVSIGLAVTQPAESQEPMQEAAPALVAPPERANMTDAMVRERVSRVRSDLRAMHTALESYRVDNRVYPARMGMLTTPIAYMSSYFPDPFAEFAYREQDPETGELLPLEDGGVLQMRFMPDLTQIRLYSVGPDGVDDTAELEYDPANGTVSPGDITRFIDLEDYVVFLDDAMSGRWARQRQHARVMAQRARHWAILNERMPASWEEFLPADGSVAVPEDHFAPGETLIYKYEEPIARIYGRGPNGRDDGGQPIPNGIYSPGSIPRGDVVATIDWTEIQKAIALRKNPSEGDDMFLNLVLKLREETGRDNALIRYQSARLTYPHYNMIPETDQLIRQVGFNGWSEEASDLLPLLLLWEPAFALIREGAALDQAENVGTEMGFQTPVPDFFFAQQATRAMVAQARYFESQGEHDKAIDNFVAALRMARDYGAENSVLIGSLISIACQSVIHRSAEGVVTSGALNEAQLARLQRELAHIEATYAGIGAGLRGERGTNQVGIAKELENLLAMPEDKLQEMRSHFATSEETSHLASASREDIAELFETFNAEATAVYEKVIAVSALEPHEVDYAAFDEQMVNRVEEVKNPLLSRAMPNFTEALHREWVMTTKRRLLQVKIALETYKLRAGRYPPTLVELRGWTIDAVPTDPFSGEAFRYWAIDDGAGYVLYGLGPAKADSPQATTYDPTNGTISPGVLY